MSDPSAMPPPPSASPPPGWYPDPTGQPRWWTGTMWSAPPPPTDPTGMSPYGHGYGYPPPDRSLAILVHVIAIFAGFLGPLIVYLVTKDRDPFTRHHAAEALNFSITLLIAYIACLALLLLLIGFVLLPIVWIGSLVLHVMAATAASRGEWYRYPLSLRLVS